MDSGHIQKKRDFTDLQKVLILRESPFKLAFTMPHREISSFQYKHHKICLQRPSHETGISYKRSLRSSLILRLMTSLYCVLAQFILVLGFLIKNCRGRSFWSVEAMQGVFLDVTGTKIVRLLLPPATKIPFMYSQKRNCVASVPISTFMCL